MEINVSRGIIYAPHQCVITKVAISIWGDRISPLMDTAGHLLLVEISEGREVSRETISIPDANIWEKVDFLRSLKINILICGAISHRFESLLVTAGIQPYPWFRGDVEEILTAHCRGNLHDGNFLLPGCRRRRQMRGQRCRRGGRFRQQKQLKEQ